LHDISSGDFLTRGGFNFAGWLATVSLSALWQIAFAPYVSDYSRYLPENVRVASTFWATYLGCTIGSTLAFSFGAVAVLAVPPGADAMDAVKQATGPLGVPMLVLFLLSVISHIRRRRAPCCRLRFSSHVATARSALRRISSATWSISCLRCWLADSTGGWNIPTACAVSRVLRPAVQSAALSGH
jgi:hypothetical protein